MTKVFVNIGLSLDGYMAPEGMTIENWEKPEYKNWGAKWGELMAWMINLSTSVITSSSDQGKYRARSMTWFVTPRSASAPTSWASECSSKARSMAL